MTAVRAIYDGNVFIPKTRCNFTNGTEVTLTIETINAGFLEKQMKLEALRKLTKEIQELNKTDPLPKEFDKILSQRVKFREISDL